MKYTFDKLNFEAEQEKKIVYYDVSCNLCLKAVAFVTRWDKRKKLVIIPLQYSPFQDEAHQSIIYTENGHIYRKSDAVLKLSRHLGFPFNLTYYLILIPKIFRDKIYDTIARNRYKWFGKCESCKING